MLSKFYYAIGAALMAGGGGAIARQLGLDDWHLIYVAGFALGVVLLGQAPSIALRARISALEAKLDSHARDAANPLQATPRAR